MLAIVISRVCHYRARGTLSRREKRRERERESFARKISARKRVFTYTRTRANGVAPRPRFAAQILERALRSRDDHLSDSHGAENISAGPEGRDVLRRLDRRPPTVREWARAWDRVATTEHEPLAMKHPRNRSAELPRTDQPSHTATSLGDRAPKSGNHLRAKFKCW